MENIYFNIETFELWNKMLIDDKKKLLSDYEFWDGFSGYKYEYLPDTLKYVLSLKTGSNINKF